MTDPDRRHQSDRHASVGSSTDRHKITTLEGIVDNLIKRVEQIETGMTDGRVMFAEMKKDMHSMKDAVDSMKEVLSRLNWTIILAVVGAVIALVVKGYTGTP